MPFGGDLLGRSKALALGGVDVEHLGASHILYGTQGTHELDDIVSVDGAEVADVHALEDVLLLGEQALHAIVEADEALASSILHQPQLAQHPSQAVAPLVVAGGRGDAEQVFLESAYRAVYGHLVVVEHDEHVVVALRHVVEALEGQAATHSSVANDGYHTTAVLAQLLGCYGHAEGGRDGVGGVSAGEAVILALLG